MKMRGWGVMAEESGVVVVGPQVYIIGGDGTHRGANTIGEVGQQQQHDDWTTASLRRAP